MGAIIAVPSLRLRGDYFALATLGFAVIVYSVAKNWVALTRGPMGLPGIPRFDLFGVSFSSNLSYLLVTIVLVLLSSFVISRIVGSPFGRVLGGIREDEIATSAMGKNVMNHYR